ncbi:L-aspartate oxidase [Lyngbya confervoides]|uniref:L-aspartate oxidase n=1 Tax=Lyngbya confervoides BDU141951 TaxID=1574623 RepID=A0ABD4T0C2_9CYAN|nr:L-aspartate oxidase [Lyngbya confervoides]MCM1982089.1 L-aspartate oxidase [Lyngbya confervoides BDU141951]
MPEAESFPCYDVVVIGAGAAGLYTALSLPKALRIALMTKDTLKQSASDWAQGGIAAAVRADDSPTLHASDTLAAGAGLCDREAVDLLVRNADRQIRRLLDMGVAFDRQQQTLALTLEAAHSRPRVLHAADATGKALIKTLTQQVLIQSNIQVLSNFFTLDLMLHPVSQICQGVWGFSEGKLTPIFAHAVVLATGGGGQVFSQTTNPALSTGDGVAMAWRAGAKLRDLEFFQFHPTALKVPNAPRFLISEAVRGEGAQLMDHQGYRFMFDYHPLGELAPRDVVSRGIFHRLEQTHQSHVWLDLRVIEAERIQRRFPKIIRFCRTWGIDVFQDPIPVSPAAHYWMGGVQANLQARTSIPGLYAVGEVASTGVHGANRLASNSLLECLVFGATLAEAITEESQSFSHCLSTIKPAQFSLRSQSLQTDAWNLITQIRQNLPDLMWRSAGINRDAQTLGQAIEQVSQWRQAIESVAPNYQQLLDQKQRLQLPLDQLRVWGETRNLADIAYLILKSALFRTESRGGHYRSDFPDSQSNWATHTSIQDHTWVQAPVKTA